MKQDEEYSYAEKDSQSNVQKQEEFIPLTAKQRNFLIQLVEERYEDEATRASLYTRIEQLSKQEATQAITDMLNNA